MFCCTEHHFSNNKLFLLTTVKVINRFEPCADESDAGATGVTRQYKITVDRALIMDKGFDISLVP